MTGFGKDAFRWGGAGVAVLAAHVAAGAMIIQLSRESNGMEAPEAVFIELEPIPEPPPGPPIDASEPVTDTAQASAAAAEEVQEEPVEEVPEPADFTPPEPAQLPPVEDFADLVPEPVPAPAFEPPPMTELPPITEFADLLPDSALALTASERPMARPERRKPEPQVTRREEPKQQRQQQAQPQQQKRREPAAQKAQPAQQKSAQPARKQAASGGGGGRSKAQPKSTGVSQSQISNWTAQVGARVTRHMSRTSVRGGRRGQVRAVVTVTIQPNGSASARLASSTGNGQIDNSLARQAARLPRMPAPPHRQSVSFQVPFLIQIK